MVGEERKGFGQTARLYNSNQYKYNYSIPVLPATGKLNIEFSVDPARHHVIASMNFFES